MHRPTRQNRPPTCPQAAAAPARARRRFLAVVVAALLLAWPCAALAGGADEGFINREYPLKALFIYNFGGYVEWPADAFASDDAPFVVCVLGTAPVDTTLREIAATRKIGGRRIVVNRAANVSEIGPCHILFIARDVHPTHGQNLVSQLRGRPVLIVGEHEGFAAMGGCVNFYIEANKIRFEINLEAARQQQLKMSAKLLALARIVQ
jgi:hypothetical protein